MNYENRIVAFIDILGFRALLDETVAKDGTDDPKRIDDVIHAYTSIREIWDLDKKSETHRLSTYSSKKVTIFSDSIVVSFIAEEPSEVFYTLLEIKWLIMRLLNHKILCRGAVALGKLIHSDEYIFGPALVEAYTLESKAALYPRVILDRNIVDAGTTFKSRDHTSRQEREYLESLLEKDSDGMYYIDYFFKTQSELDDPEYDFPAYIENLGAIIRKGLMGSTHHTKADLRIKYSWMRERYNRMVEVASNEEAIMRLKSAGELELADFYSDLKKISPNKH
jgi:hypothetical protein